MRRLIIYIIGLAVLAACSTTKHLPEGEILYTGQKPTIVENRSATSVGETAMEEVEAALAKAPNNSLLGSSTIRTPFPVGLWIYSGFAKYEKGFGRWIFDHFGATPVLMSSVNPEIRRKAAANLLRDYGYFNGTVNYKTFIDPKDSLKAKLQYTVNMRNPYFIDTVVYHGFSGRTLRIMESSRRRSLISPGEQFNVTDLDGERTRISTLLRNVGCYYFRPDYLTYQADTTQIPGGHVVMRMIPVPGMPAVAEKPFYLGNRAVYLMGRQGQQPNDSMDYKGVRIHYYNKPEVRPNMLYRWLDYQGYRKKSQVQDSTGISRRRSMQNLYSLHRQTRVQERLANVGIFRYVEMQYTPRDTSFVSDTLDLNIYAALDKLYDAEFDFNVKMKSNNQMGPGASFTVTKNNVFGGGESWNVKLDGSYEWQTGKDRSSLMNSYELGISTALMFPRVVFPRMGKREYDFPATTTFKLYANQLNRAKYYKLLAFGGNATYDFQPKRTSKHSITPFRLTFNVLRNPTDAFNQLQEENPALYISLRDQFIPAMEYTYTYDNASVPRKRNPVWWQTTVASAGNITSAIFCIFGEPFGKKRKELLGVPFAQFLKLNSEFRYHYRIDKNQMIASRIAGGVIWSYGNMQAAPYTEQFYIGGANSVRAFSVRSAGPGGYPPADDKFAFIDHVGDIRMEANVEYRFRIISDLHGAIFLDAGNVWLMRKEEARPYGEFTLKNFPKQVALGTGVGLRYDMDFLVFRLDLGIGLHNPYETGKSGYYNIPRFKDSMALHFAIGYPF
ncbi:BamA/TamA family outer membrane protein [Bacteroides helcogenes]|uniref:Surface antigen (D15) n=1 Tax=Bacteroides helcogenes (strain ATCC 35417 / DSM 20613 / JCM 6297 / CCUG 15421 / P 36-108) TaxID=693979 RepID=E6SSN0_BACT6|nr:BamA/TamA family outer membrane protein [Bacteroides helcogenes]ADV43143.1 surface antigen (D15) [Bacteroides helcogenes P 36-108]MDY5239121.1 BamA/TamA family outer membrane protein [Bacteroides helcogenes]